MSLTPGQQYAYGFLARCAEENLTPEETNERAKIAMVKVAEPSVLGALGTMLAAGSKLGLLGYTAGSIGIGAGAGLTAAKALNSEIDEDDLRKQEILSQLRLNTQRLKALTKQQAPPRLV